MITTPRDPSIAGVPIVPSDTEDVPRGATRGLAWSEPCNLAVVWLDGTQNVLPAGLLAPQLIHPLMVRRVLATGTTAGVAIWAFY